MCLSWSDLYLFIKALTLVIFIQLFWIYITINETRIWLLFFPPCLNKNYSISLLLGTGHNLTWLNWLCLDWGEVCVSMPGYMGYFKHPMHTSNPLEQQAEVWDDWMVLRILPLGSLWQAECQCGWSRLHCHNSSRNVLIMALGSNLFGRTSWLHKNPFCKCPGFYILNSLLQSKEVALGFNTGLDGECGDGRRGKVFACEGMLSKHLGRNGQSSSRVCEGQTRCTLSFGPWLMPSRGRGNQLLSHSS